MILTPATRYVTLLSVVLALAFTATLVACGSDEPSGVTGPDSTASTPTETPASPARTPSMTGSGSAPATDAPATASPAASGSDEPSGVTRPDSTVSTPTETPSSPARTPSTPGSGDAPTDTDAPVPADAAAPPVLGPTSAETDREALVAFYNATDGENWNSSDNWLSDAPLGEWEGVYTNEDGRVGRMELVRYGLSWEIPAELGSLSQPERAAPSRQRVERGDTCGARQPLQLEITGPRLQRVERGDTGGRQPLQP